MGEETEHGDQAGPNDEGLRDGGVADGVGIRGSAVGDKVDACDGAEPL